MDPNAVLIQLRESLADIANPDQYVDREVAIEFAVEAFEDLDGWLSKGGFLPTDWERKA